MSAEAVVALVSVVVVLQVATAGFLWRNLSNQISAVKSDLETQIGAVKDDLQKQIGAVRTDLGTVKTSLEDQAGTLKTDLEKQIAAVKSDLEKQIGAVKDDLEKQIADSAARAEQAHARIESNIRDTENRLTARIDGQTERIDALHRDLRGLGERIARVEAGQDAEQAVATGSYPP